LRKINENLKDKLASAETIELKRRESRGSSPSLKLITENQPELTNSPNENNLSQSYSQILAEETNATTTPEGSPTLNSSSSPSPGDDKQVQVENASNAEKIMANIKSNPDEFYETNHLLKFQSYSPFSKMKVQQVEKQIDVKEGLLRKWSRSINEINRTCGEYTKCLDLFGNQLLQDKSSFEKNKEAQYILELIAQFFKENAAYLEVLTKIVNNTVYTPLRNFYKEVIPSYKESKKKVQKAFEDMEIIETKYYNIKKAAMMKNQSEGQNTMNSYIHTFKNFELARLNHFKNLNNINSKFNTELVDKMCTIFSSNMAYANSFYDLFERIEKEIKVYSSSAAEIKAQNCELLTQQFQQAQSKIENNDLMNYTFPSIKNAVKEGYLFVKSETIGFKKRYCYIQENGMLCWAKESDPTHEQPKIKQVADIKFCRVKVANDNVFSSCFELMSAFLKKPIVFHASSDSIMMSWMSAIEKHIETLLFESPSTSQKTPASTQKQDPVKTKTEDPAVSEAKQALVNKIVQSNNCADCGFGSPSWLSLNLGVIICLECSGFHRKLGPNISKVRSFKMDNLSLPTLELFSHLPTEEINKVWEFHKDLASEQKPTPESDKERRGLFIKQKYVEKKFLNKDIQADDLTLVCEALKNKDLIQVITMLALTKVDLNKIHGINKRKQGLLHFACANSTKDIIELLLLNGCSLNLSDQDGCKPLDHSMSGNNIEVMEYLLNKLEEK